MKQINLQFHVTQNDLIEFLNDEATDLFVVGVRVSPQFFATKLLWPCTLPDGIRRLALCPKALDAAVSSMQEFVRVNENSLHVTLPILSENYLIEGSLGCVIENDEAAYSIYKSIIGKFKKSLRCGATAINPITNAVTPIKSHWYSANAFEMQRLGTVMKALTGNAVIRLG